MIRYILILFLCLCSLNINAQKIYYGNSTMRSDIVCNVKNNALYNLDSQMSSNIIVRFDGTYVYKGNYKMNI